MNRQHACNQCRPGSTPQEQIAGVSSDRPGCGFEVCRGGDTVGVLDCANVGGGGLDFAKIYSADRPSGCYFAREANKTYYNYATGGQPDAERPNVCYDEGCTLASSTTLPAGSDEEGRGLGECEISETAAACSDEAGFLTEAECRMLFGERLSVSPPSGWPGTPRNCYVLKSEGAGDTYYWNSGGVVTDQMDNGSGKLRVFVCRVCPSDSSSTITTTTATATSTTTVTTTTITTTTTTVTTVTTATTTTTVTTATTTTTVTTVTTVTTTTTTTTPTTVDSGLCQGQCGSRAGIYDAVADDLCLCNDDCGDHCCDGYWSTCVDTPAPTAPSTIATTTAPQTCRAHCYSSEALFMQPGGKLCTCDADCVVCCPGRAAVCGEYEGVECTRCRVQEGFAFDSLPVPRVCDACTYTPDGLALPMEECEAASGGAGPVPCPLPEPTCDECTARGCFFGPQHLAVQGECEVCRALDRTMQALGEPGCVTCEVCEAAGCYDWMPAATEPGAPDVCGLCVELWESTTCLGSIDSALVTCTGCSASNDSCTACDYALDSVQEPLSLPRGHCRKLFRTESGAPTCPETTTTHIPTTAVRRDCSAIACTMEECAAFLCGADCTGSCGWCTGCFNAGEAGCRNDSSTSRSELASGDCPITTTVLPAPADCTVATCTEAQCKLIPCGAQCKGSCGWLSRASPMRCAAGATTTLSEETMGDCAGSLPPVSVCATHGCGAQCAEEPGCGWVSKRGSCEPGAKTSKSELTAGDCGNAVDCGAIKCGADCKGVCGWASKVDQCRQGSHTTKAEESAGECTPTEAPPPAAEANVVAAGTAEAPHCSWMGACDWSDAIRDACGLALCDAAGLVFVRVVSDTGSFC